MWLWECPEPLHSSARERAPRVLGSPRLQHSPQSFSRKHGAQGHPRKLPRPALPLSDAQLHVTPDAKQPESSRPLITAGRPQLARTRTVAFPPRRPGAPAGPRAGPSRGSAGSRRALSRRGPCQPPPLPRAWDRLWLTRPHTAAQYKALSRPELKFALKSTFKTQAAGGGWDASSPSPRSAVRGKAQARGRALQPRGPLRAASARSSTHRVGRKTRATVGASPALCRWWDSGRGRGWQTRAGDQQGDRCLLTDTSTFQRRRWLTS